VGNSVFCPFYFDHSVVFLFYGVVDSSIDLKELRLSQKKRGSGSRIGTARESSSCSISSKRRDTLVTNPMLRKGPDSNYDKRNKSVVICDIDIYTIILCCPCYMPKYVPRLEDIMHDPEGECIMPSNLGTYFDI
jgi:hypothetical protein